MTRDLAPGDEYIVTYMPFVPGAKATEALIRACAGWSAADLGNRLGVTRQMVSNLENGHNRMTRMQSGSGKK